MYLYLWLKVKFDNNNEFFRYDFLLILIHFIYLALIRCYRLLKCDDIVNDIDLKVKFIYSKLKFTLLYIPEKKRFTVIMVIVKNFICIFYSNKVLQATEM